MSYRSQIISGIAVTAVARLASQLAMWAITLIVMRLLAPSDYGLLAMATVVGAFLMLLGEAGLGAALVQAKHLDTDTVRRAFAAVIVLNGALCLLQVGAAPLIAWFFDEPRLTAILWVLSLQFIISIFIVIPLVHLRRRLSFKVLSLIDLMSALAGALTALALASAGYGVWSLVIGMLLTRGCTAIALNAICPPGAPHFSLKAMRALLVFAGHVTTGRVLWYLYSHSDILIAGKLLGKEALGYYSVSMHVASLPVSKLSMVLNGVVYPAFARTRDSQQLASYLVKGIRWVSFLAFPVLWGLSSVSDELVSVALGDRWAPAIFPLQMLALIMPLRIVSNIVPSALDAAGKPDITVRNLLLTNAVMVPALIIGSAWGIFGLTMVWVCVWPLVFFANLRRSLSALNVPWRIVFGALVPPVLCALGMYLCVIAGNFALRDMHEFYRLGLLVLIGALSYALFAVAFNRQTCTELLALRKL